MPPTTRRMTASGVKPAEEYAETPKRIRNPGTGIEKPKDPSRVTTKRRGSNGGRKQKAKKTDRGVKKNDLVEKDIQRNMDALKRQEPQGQGVQPTTPAGESGVLDQGKGEWKRKDSIFENLEKVTDETKEKEELCLNVNETKKPGARRVRFEPDVCEMVEDENGKWTGIHYTDQQEVEITAEERARESMPVKRDEGKIRSQMRNKKTEGESSSKEERPKLAAAKPQQAEKRSNTEAKNIKLKKGKNSRESENNTPDLNTLDEDETISYTKGDEKAPKTKMLINNGKPISSQKRPREIGFDRQELQDSGSLEFDAAEPSTLANRIHDIWDKSKFTFYAMDVPDGWDEVYETMEPAFRLVSRWITDQTFEHFWGSLVFGDVENFSDVDGQPATRIVPVQLTPVQRRLLSDDLWELGAVHRFRFLPIIGGWAESKTYHQPSNNVASMTTLHQAFLQNCYARFHRSSESRQLRFLFFLAVNLGHELAHLVFRKRRLDETGDIEEEEPYWNSELVHKELGTAWEDFMFGGRIQMLNASPDPLSQYGLAVLPLEMARWSPFRDRLCRIAALPMEWINDQFSEAWWTDPAKANERIPGNPPLSSIRATVNRTTRSSVLLNNTHEEWEGTFPNAKNIMGH